MPRGGKRKGAGRPATLSLTEIVTVLEIYRDLRFKLESAREDQALGSRPGGQEMDAIHAEINAIPVSQRARWWAESDRAEDLRTDMESIRRERDGISAEDEVSIPAMLVTAERRRLYGGKDDLLAAVAATASAEFGKVVSARQVRRIINEDF